MQHNYGISTSIAQSRGASFNKIRHLARQYVDALVFRLQELEDLALQAADYETYIPEIYPYFRRLSSIFTKRSQEFQGLCSLIENALSQFPDEEEEQREEKIEVEKNFHRLQAPMLTQIIKTSNLLLRVWRDRLEKNVPLPIDVQESFTEMVTIIEDARESLEKNGYDAQIDPEILTVAQNALDFLAVLIEQAPPLIDFEKEIKAALRKKKIRHEA